MRNGWGLFQGGIQARLTKGIVLITVLSLLFGCKKNSDHELLKINFPVPDQSVVDDYEWELREKDTRELDRLVLNENYDHLTPDGNLEGVVVVSDEGLFYHDKEQLKKNRDLSLDEIVKEMDRMSDEEFKKKISQQENVYTLHQLRSILIKLKNERVKATPAPANTWIYLNTESHTRPQDIIPVLVMLKSLDIEFKPGQPRY
jgi:hypothetical protein